MKGEHIMKLEKEKMKLAERKKIAHLMFLSLFDLIDEEKRSELNKWLKKRKENQTLFQHLEDPAYQSQHFSRYTQFNAIEGWEKVEPRLKSKSNNRFYRLLPYAAILILCIGIITFLRTNSPQTNIPVSLHKNISNPTVRLVMEDGNTLELNTTDSSQRLEHEDFKSDGKQLVYKHTESSGSPRFHLLQVPRGGEYALVLADGTRVWLNAETELSYPSYFSGKDRRVKLKGEAYFEVTADTSMPFIVETKHLQINVLGTSFNISAYPDESHHATLAKGKIKAIYEEKQVILSPGEQALLTDSGMIVHAVDIATYTSWKERRFVFKNKPLQEVARDLERWYNVRLTIRQDAQPIRLTANLPKYENIEKILHIIENIARVKCETNDQEIIIKPE